MNDYPGSEDARLHELLHDAVSDVEPSDSLESIRSRTTVTPFRRRRPWLLGAGAAVVATAATVTAVAVIGDQPGTTTAQPPGFAGSPTVAGTPQGGASAPSGDPSDQSSDAASEAASNAATDDPDDGPTGSTEGTQTVPVYYVGETSHGPRLFREFHQVDNPVPAELAAAREAVSQRPDDPDYTVPWPTGTDVLWVKYDPNQDLISVNLTSPDGDSLTDRPAGMSSEQAELALQQLVYTVQAATQDRPKVELWVDDSRADTVLGVDTTQPVSEADPLAVISVVWIIDPAEGAQLTVPFEVSGLANSFEANVQWELMQGDTVVKRGFTSAEEAFTMAPYSFTVKNVPPGDYTLVVHDDDPSGGAEGPGPTVDTKNITVLP